MNPPQPPLPYTESGNGPQVAILDWTPWQTTTLADALTPSYRVINIQPPIPPPGEGQDEAAAQNTAAALAATLETAGLTQYALIGVSLGADAALRLALLRPHAVTALILVSPTCVAPEPPQTPPDPQPWQTPTQTMLAHPENPAHPPPDPARAAALAALSQQWQNANALLPQLQTPTLAIFGQEDRLIPPQAPSLWRQQAPNCNICFIYDAAHAITLDRPQALHSLASDYLQRRETFIVENRNSQINP